MAYSGYGSETPYSEFGNDAVRTRWTPYSYGYPSYVHHVPYKAGGEVTRQVARPFFGRSCCLITFLSLVSVGILAAAIALGVVAVQNSNESCPTFSCPSGYELDTTGTTCNALPTTAADPCATIPTFECPIGYELDASGTKCNAVSTDAAVVCATVSTFECPAGYTLSSSGVSCDDIDECVAGLDGCSDICTNVNGTYVCSCPDGFALLGENCVAISGATTQTTANCDTTCPTFTCPTGYELDASGTSCNALPTSTGAAAETTAAAAETTAAAAETTAAAAETTAAAAATTAAAETTTIAEQTTTAAETTAAETTAAETTTAEITTSTIAETTTTEAKTTTAAPTTTTADSLVPAPQDGFAPYPLDPIVPGPTYVPEGWSAYPGQQVNGGGKLEGVVTGDACLGACMASTTCEAFDFNTGFSECWIHEAGTKCGTLNTVDYVYHMKKLPLCSDTDPTYPAPVLTNP